MQSVTRKRWLAVKAGWMLLAAAVWGGVISALVTWLFAPGQRPGARTFNPGRFDLMDIVPVGYAVFAMALGICAGVLLRRTLPAMAVTLAGFLAVRVVIALWLRPHYLSAVTATYNLFRGYTPRGSYWQLAQGVRAPNGQLLPQPNGLAALRRTAGFLPPRLRGADPGRFAVTPSCRAALAGFRGFVTYQPASRYWAFQGIETAIFIALAAALLAVTAVVLARRDA